MDYLEIDKKYVWHPWRSNRTCPDAIFTEGKGCKVKDINGKEYIDATSAVLNASCGISNEYIINRIYEQMKKITNFDLTRFSTLPVIELAEKMANLLPESLSRVFFCSSGSEAVETAYKLATTHARLSGKNDSKVISIKNAYHGTTIAGCEMSHSVFIKGYDIEIPNHFYSINIPFCEKCFSLKPHSNCEYPPIDELEKLIIQLGANNIAAIFVEPIMGIGGYIFLPDHFLHMIKEMCTKYHILLVYDETMTSFGRTGKMFAFEHSNTVPDILITGKGISSGYFPVSTISTSEEIYQLFEADPYLSGFRHGHTNSGHALGATAALASIEYIEVHDLVNNANIMGKLLYNLLKSQLQAFDFCGELRQKGLIVAFNVMDAELCEKILAITLKNGLIVRETQGVIALLPALIITEAECYEIVDKLIKSLSEISMM